MNTKNLDIYAVISTFHRISTIVHLYHVRRHRLAIVEDQIVSFRLAQFLISRGSLHQPNHVKLILMLTPCLPDS
jgi:hypothetical protein